MNQNIELEEKKESEKKAQPEPESEVHQRKPEINLDKYEKNPFEEQDKVPSTDELLK